MSTHRRHMTADLHKESHVTYRNLARACTQMRGRIALSATAAASVIAAVLLAVVGFGQPASAASTNRAANTGAASGLGQLSGLLPSGHLTEESTIQINLSNETARLPIYPGVAPVPHHPGHTENVWYLLLDASDSGLAHDLGVNYAPKLADIAIGDPGAVQTVTLANPSPSQNHFGPAVVHFQGAPDFSPTRIAVPGPTGFPLKKFQPGAVAGPGYSPFIRIKGSDVVYNAPIIATGNGPFD